MLAAYLDTGYNIVLVAHIFCAIVGFGAVFLNGLYGAQIKAQSRAGRLPESVAIYEANFKVSSVGEYFIYAVFVLGLALVGMSDKTWKFDQTWVWLSTGLFLVGLAIVHGLLRPRVKRLGGLLRELATGSPGAGAAAGPPPQALELQKLGPQIGVIGATLNLLLVVLVVLMVFKPGAPGFGF